MNFVGAMTFTGVAKTISKDIVDPFTLQNGSIVILAALLSAIFWNLLTWYYGIPSSSSHALIGSIAGAALLLKALRLLITQDLQKLSKHCYYLPILAFVVGFIIYSIFKVVFKNANLAKTNKRFRYMQIATAALQSYSHGTNDAQKAMGIITMALIANGYLGANADVPFWVQFSCAIAMGLGTSVGGWKIIKTVGGKIMKIRPINGVAADLTGAADYFRGYIHACACKYHTCYLFWYFRCRCFSPSKRSKMGYCPTDVSYLGYYPANYGIISSSSAISY